MITDRPYMGVRQLFGAVIARDPEALASQYACIKPEMLGTELGSNLAHDYYEQGMIPKRVAVGNYLSAAISDAYTFYDCVLDEDMSNKQRLEIARHPSSIAALSAAALEPSFVPSVMVNDKKYSLLSVSPDKTHIVNYGAPMRRSDEGCPFAGRNEHEKVDPLFAKFAPWVASLVLSHHDAYQS